MAGSIRNCGFRKQNMYENLMVSNTAAVQSQRCVIHQWPLAPPAPSINVPYLHHQDVLLDHHHQIPQLQVQRLDGFAPPEVCCRVDCAVQSPDNSVHPTPALLHEAVWGSLDVIVEVGILSASKEARAVNRLVTHLKSKQPMCTLGPSHPRQKVPGHLFGEWRA